MNIVPTSPLPTEPTRFPHARQPLGTVKVAPNGTRRDRFHREIKVSNEKGGKCWKHYARWWWETHRGPVPAGKLVLHRDGNTMNDDPSNFVLGTHADQAFINHDADPEMSERNYRAMRAGTARANRLRALQFRRENYLRFQWYPVDHGTRQIHNTPMRSKSLAVASILPPELAALLTPVLATPEGPLRGIAGLEATILGWPGLTMTQAMVLAVLARHEEYGTGLWVSRNGLLSGVQELRKRWGYGSLSKSGLCSEMCHLRRRGWLVSNRAPVGRGSIYHITREGLGARGPHADVSPMRGRVVREELGRLGFLEGYTRVTSKSPEPARAAAARVRKQLQFA